MTRRNAPLAILLVSLFIVCGCSSSTTDEQSVGFSIASSGDTTVVTVMSPWQPGTTMARYAITTPYRRIACTSATHVGFLRELGLMDRLVGVCVPSRIYNLTDEQRATITDLGDDIKPNLEAILMPSSSPPMAKAMPPSHR